MAKILFIQPAFAHYRFKLFELLHKRHEITFVFLANKSRYPSSTVPNSEWATVYLNRKVNPFWMFDLARLIMKIKPEIVITSNNGSYQSIVAGISGRLLDIPVILWSEAWYYKKSWKRKSWWKKPFNIMMVNLTSLTAKAIVAGGSKSYKYNNKLVRGKKPVFLAFQSTVDFAQGVNSLSNEVIELKNSFNGEINILYFSKIIPLKGLDFLIRAFSQIESHYSNIKLHIVGDGSFRNHCEQLARELQIKSIQFYGSVENERAWTYYYLADIFVLPHSGTLIEGWGLVINEAASMGLPIITTDAAGAAEDLVVDGVNGYVVEAGNQSALKNALISLISDKSQRINMGKQSRLLFEKINDYSKMANGFEKAITYILEDQTPR